MKYIPYLFFFLFCCVACNNHQESQIQVTLEVAGSNRPELEKVLSHFENEKPDKLKLEAARYLIANMGGHTSLQGKRLEVYKKMVREAKKPISKDTLAVIWKRAKAVKGEGMEMEEDAALISSAYLIRHIDQSVEGWLASPWKEQVEFEEFCHTILPYRVNSEQLSAGWVDSLRVRYAPVIKDIKDAKRAYEAVMKKLDKEFRESEVPCPYTPDILTLDNMKIGPCKDQCMLTVAILRALSIPSAYDYVTHWTNYSRVGHSWVTWVYKGETYTWEKKDTVARKANRIPASLMKAEFIPDEDYLYSVDTLKRVSKVYRAGYGPEVAEDVSEVYGLKGYCEIEVPGKVEIAYLCTFRTGKDWEPVDAVYVKRGKCKFEHLGCGTVYLIMEKRGDKLLPLSSPFILREGGKVEWLVADKQVTEEVRLTRKYPLMGHWITQWHKMIGGRIEASNRPDFEQAVVLDSLTETPVYRNLLRNHHLEECFRYVRYVCPENCRTPLAELEFHEASNEMIRNEITLTPTAGDTALSASSDRLRKGKASTLQIERDEALKKGKMVTSVLDDTAQAVSAGVLLKGEPIGSEGLPERSMRQTFDGNLMSVCSTKKKYWVGLDLKKPCRIGDIVLYPKNDGNFIDIGDRYELFYYDKGWVSLGKQTAIDFFLIYRNVPKGALLLLKDYSKGKEERIFIYKQDKQVWG